MKASPGPLHPRRTSRNGYQYFFYVKHHGQGGPDDSQWLPELNQDEEFAIFDLADFHDLGDGEGNLYGLRIGSNGEILYLGTEDEQVAEFPATAENQPWHGYPLWPMRRVRRKLHAPREALRRMEEERLLTAKQRKRLEKGKGI